MKFQIVKLIACSIIALEILVMTFFYRVLLSVGFIMISYCSFSSKLFLYKQMHTLPWRVTCLIMAVFPMLPTVGKFSNYIIVSGAGLLLSLAITFCACRPELQLIRSEGREPHRVKLLMSLQVFFLFLSTFVVFNTSNCIARDTPIPMINHILSWTLLVSSFLFTLLGSSYVVTRLLNIYSSLVALYLLLSSFLSIIQVYAFTSGSTLVRVEKFYDDLVATTCTSSNRYDKSYYTLIMGYFKAKLGNKRVGKIFDIQFSRKIHKEQKNTKERSLIVQDFHRAYIFIYLIIGAFFGTGNIASLNSFDVSSVFCFVTVFNPFIMGGLLLLKVIIPFIMVTCVFRAIHVVLNLPTRGLLLIVLLMSDFMGLHFFFLVRDTGSWLDIGTSISHYVIVMSTIIFVIVLYGVATLLTSFNLSYTNKSFKLHWL
ncbi:GPI ethanolamine phosphate transferase 1 [Nymphon striatum]|nr:GPI ethanolamine phosphate transferase 1 [Nymphon striatum]